MFLLFLFALKLLVFVIVARLYYLHKNASKSRQWDGRPAKTIIVLGSGGHTAEMMTLVTELNKINYSPRYYIIASTDTTSESKVMAVEGSLSPDTASTSSLLKPKTSSKTDFTIIRIDRSRVVGQSYFSSVFTTCRSIWQSIPLVYRIQPDLVLCNGPGTCVPICLIAFALKMLGALSGQCKIVFFESFCRVKTISLSGRILLWFVDCFVVQWPQLVANSSKMKYFGRLM